MGPGWHPGCSLLNYARLRLAACASRLRCGFPAGKARLPTSARLRLAARASRLRCELSAVWGRLPAFVGLRRAARFLFS